MYGSIKKNKCILLPVDFITFIASLGPDFHKNFGLNVILQAKHAIEVFLLDLSCGLGEEH